MKLLSEFNNCLFSSIVNHNNASGRLPIRTLGCVGVCVCGSNLTNSFEETAAKKQRRIRATNAIYQLNCVCVRIWMCVCVCVWLWVLYICVTMLITSILLNYSCSRPTIWSSRYFAIMPLFTPYGGTINATEAATFCQLPWDMWVSQNMLLFTKRLMLTYIYLLVYK